MAKQKPIDKEKTETRTPLPTDGAFDFCNRVFDELKARGYSVGSMQREAPMGIAFGDCYISKWRNLETDDFYALDGRVTFYPSPRNATRATIEWYVAAKVVPAPVAA